MFKIRHSIRYVMLAAMLLLFTFGAIQSQAQTLSAGCSALNGATPISQDTGINVAVSLGTTNSFDQGETISWDIVTTGDVVVITVIIINMDTNQTANFSSASGSFNISATANYDVAIAASAGTTDIFTPGPYSVNINASCAAGQGNSNANNANPNGLGNGNGNGQGNPPVAPPDSRANFGFGDLFATVYSIIDGNDLPVVQLYCYDETTDTAFVGFVITVEDVDITEPVTEATLLASVSSGDCSAEFYLLPDDEFQINVYSPEGKIYELISTDLNFDDAIMRYFDPNE